MKKRVLVPLLAIFLVLALALGLYWRFHPTHYKFNDRFIVGNTAENILAKYGEFAYCKYDETGNYIYAEYVASQYNVPKYLRGITRKWYVIEFEDGVATNVEIREGAYMG